ncbi:MAG: FAD-dependent oxidoreductase [Bradyrhizobium sp.]|jgi:monoamine oxidase|uniref:flavin monoamine oxidase family protein n=1 Tax=Bradyrhizobium sp. TaxID=376 RepID=UPI001203972D|nr:NAD(P)/FAD-dependent oxidoreductase [Bradyrhizobium sp.]THD54710.1 MAG: FAD-dependent oxidoreductase [Bradyrhizobium sp.]
MSLPSEVDVAIVGAGAAGLGAARALETSGLSLIVLEARDRVGGRGHTIMAAPDITFDVGCGWLHSADQNSFVRVAEQLNFEIDKTRPPWREQGFDAVFPASERFDFIDALDAFYDRAEQAAKEVATTGRDRPANTCLEPGNRWNPMIDAISTYVNGAELDRVSILDMDAYQDSEINWRIRRGYGALMAAYGAPCPLALNTQVTLIDHSGQRVRIETSNGALSAARVIVTVPTNLIADEAIRFHPVLPAKVDAARGLPLGLANKVMLALDQPEALPKDGNLRGATMRAAMGGYHLRPFGQACIEGFFGGRFARELENAGDGALAAQAIDEIVALLGSDYRRRLKPLAESRWAHDPFARGSYSHALPGHAGKRAVLAAPVDNRLFFAGEATSPNFFSTAHGARDSGERAAREVMGLARS